MSAIEHSAEHYGQLVDYYRANNWTAGLATVTRGISLMKQERIFSLLAVLIFTAAVWVYSKESTSIASTS